jgi:RNA polymerase sigma factor (sigma-70 family)
MPRTGNRSTDDFSDRPSEELIVLVQQGQSEPAQQELLARSYRLARAVVERLARRHRMSAADTDDAQQEVACRLPRLLRHSQPGRHGPFGRLVAVAARRWFLNYLRAWRRQRRRVHPVARANVLLGDDCDQGSPLVCSSYPLPPRFADPLALLLWQERLARLEEAVGTLDELGRALCAGVRAGRSLAELAPELDLSVDATRRSWRKVKAVLRCRLDAPVAEKC